jgi:hypothetical protein
MKRISLFVLVMLISNLSKAQNENAATTVKSKSEPLLTVIKKINKDKGAYFLFADSSIGVIKVDDKFDPANSVETILSNILSTTDLGYKKIGEKTFVIVYKKQPIKNVDKLNQYTFNENGISYVALEDTVIKSEVRVLKGMVFNQKDNSPLEGVTI